MRWEPEWVVINNLSSSTHRVLAFSSLCSALVPLLSLFLGIIALPFHDKRVVVQNKVAGCEKSSF